MPAYCARIDSRVMHGIVLSMEAMEQRAVIRRTFDTIADSYDYPGNPWFDQCAAELCKRGRLATGQEALDIATGTGKVALLLASTMPRASVLGVDLSSGMLARARKKAAIAGLKNVSFEEGAFEDLSYEGRFDLVTCSFGLFFVEDVVAALRGFAAQARPGGQVIISSFAAGAFSPFTDSFSRLYSEFGFEIGPSRWQRLSTEELLSQVFEDAGLDRPECTRHDFSFELTHAQQWWALVWSAGYRGMLMAMEEEQLARFKEEHLKEVENLLNSGETQLKVEVLIAAASTRSKP